MKNTESKPCAVLVENKRQLLVGIIFISIGVFFYLVDRPPDQLKIIPEGFNLYRETGNLFGALGGSLPSFVHVFAFCLITAGFVAYEKARYLLICIGWGGIELIFEVAQSDYVYPYIKAGMTSTVGSTGYLQSVNSYFEYGVFDPMDVASVIIGVFIAYLIMQLTRKGGVDKCRKPGQGLI